MRIRALVIRIIRQFLRDKRTLAMMLVAPLLIMTLLHLVFNGESYIPKVGLVNAPAAVMEKLDSDDTKLTEYDSEKAAEAGALEQEIDGYLVFDGPIPKQIVLEGSDPSVNGALMKWIQQAKKQLSPSQGQMELTIDYIHGSEDMGQFDFFGPVLLGFFAFFFVFIISGISFLRERTSGTLEKLLSSPLRKWEIVVGYVLGFGIFTMLQATLIAWYSIYVLGMLMEGSFIYVLLITLLLSMTALTLGTLLSAFANNEFQMIQFIPVIIVPQFFFSGLINLDTISDWLSWLGPITPLYYAADALRDIMVRGQGWDAIYGNMMMLAGFSALFIFLNILALRKHRSV
ncbi:ABC transporter permease [Mesobacillus subterraneus]|uniref:ABC transporter permease n=1 Tax=Mesobacillus subterraneus TaxID=285983 RepID=A0A427TS13_9BACI|nr:ABC transporter permease [Mesobacillus subterraneus]RSD27216.1 ABC transporter permease [Mesobacillus subterraneus]